MSEQLASWNDTADAQAIVDFVERVTTEGGPDYVPPAERIAVFDNDGTLWCEKPMPIELGFILERLAEMAEADESLREQQPWKAAREKDYAWLGEVITKHYHGDDSRREGADGRHPPGLRRADRRRVLGGRRRVPARRDAPDARPRRSTPAATCRWSSCCATSRRTASPTTSPRAATATSCGRSPSEMYGIPPERVIGSSNALALHRRRARRVGRLRGRDRTSSTTARQAGAHLEPHRPAADPRRRQLERRHPDAPVRRREGPARRSGCSCSTTTASASSTTPPAPRSRSRRQPHEDWTVVSIKNDWATVFAGRLLVADDGDCAASLLRGHGGVPGGTFRMGSEDFYPEERPVREVSVEGVLDRRAPGDGRGVPTLREGRPAT